MSFTKLFSKVWQMTSRLGTGKTVNFVYSVVSYYIIPEKLRGILIVWYVLASQRMEGFLIPVLVFGE
jgi:hypothetical protein